MLASPVLDVAVGVIFVFFLVALISSQVGDRVSTWLRWRAKDLEAGIRNLIVGRQNPHLLDELYNNPLIQALAPADTLGTRVLQSSLLKWFVYPNRLATNIPPSTFALALMDMLVPTESGQTSLDQLQASIATLPTSSPMRSPLLSLVSSADGKVDNFRTNVEAWFDNTIDKTSQIYKQHMFVLTFLISAAIAVLLNVDTIGIATELWQDSSLRAALTVQVTQYAQGTPQQSEAIKQLESLNLPVGWQVTVKPKPNLYPNDWLPQPGQPDPVIGLRDYALKLAGWFITAFAGAQGAPFWFDLLKKITK